MQRLSYLPPVRDPEVVYHEHVPLLPAIEHKVPPHCVSNVAHCTIRYGRTIAIASVHTKAQFSRGCFQSDIEEAGSPQDPGVEQLFETPQARHNTWSNEIPDVCVCVCVCGGVGVCVCGGGWVCVCVGGL